MVSDEGHHLKVELFEALTGFLTIFIAIALVVGVVFVFLQNWRATIIPVVAIPISLVGTFSCPRRLRRLDQQPVAVRLGAGGGHRGAVNDDVERLLETAINKLGRSARAYSRVLKVGRTIADLVGSDDILASHIAEAIR